MKKIFNALKTKTAKAGALVLGTFAATAANAQVDVSEVVTEIGLAKTAIVSIGSAVLVAIAAVLLFKLVRRAM